MLAGRVAADLQDLKVAEEIELERMDAIMERSA